MSLTPLRIPSFVSCIWPTPHGVDRECAIQPQGPAQLEPAFTRSWQAAGRTDRARGRPRNPDQRDHRTVARAIRVAFGRNCAADGLPLSPAFMLSLLFAQQPILCREC